MWEITKLNMSVSFICHETSDENLAPIHGTTKVSKQREVGYELWLLWSHHRLAMKEKKSAISVGIKNTKAR